MLIKNLNAILKQHPGNHSAQPAWRQLVHRYVHFSVELPERPLFRVAVQTAENIFTALNLDWVHLSNFTVSELFGCLYTEQPSTPRAVPHRAWITAWSVCWPKHTSAHKSTADLPKNKVSISLIGRIFGQTRGNLK